MQDGINSHLNNLVLICQSTHNTIFVERSVKKTLQITKRTSGQSLKYWLKDATQPELIIR
jgi:hypothetical protein